MSVGVDFVRLHVDFFVLGLSDPLRLLNEADVCGSCDQVAGDGTEVCVESAGERGSGVGVGTPPGGVRRELTLRLLDLLGVLREFDLLPSILIEVGDDLVLRRSNLVQVEPIEDHVEPIRNEVEPIRKEDRRNLDLDESDLVLLWSDLVEVRDDFGLLGSDLVEVRNDLGLLGSDLVEVRDDLGLLDSNLIEVRLDLVLPGSDLLEVGGEFALLGPDMVGVGRGSLLLGPVLVGIRRDPARLGLNVVGVLLDPVLLRSVLVAIWCDVVLAGWSRVGVRCEYGLVRPISCAVRSFPPSLRGEVNLDGGSARQEDRDAVVNGGAVEGVVVGRGRTRPLRDPHLRHG